jgi:hypothetical protein
VATLATLAPMVMVALIVARAKYTAQRPQRASAGRSCR